MKQLWNRLKAWSPLRRLVIVELKTEGLSRMFTACPRCGAVLLKDHPALGRYTAPDGTILCCYGCRAFVKETIVRTTPPPKAKGRR